MAFVFKTQYAHDAQPTDAAQPHKPGFYPAKIVNAEEKYSRSGKPMLVLSLEVDPGGIRTLDIKEYLLLETSASWKVEQYLAAIGVQFGQGQDVSVDANTFIGGNCYLLTYNEPGQTNPDRLFMKPLKAFRKQDIPHSGPLTDAELEHWGLNADGTRKGSREEQRANAQPHQQQGAWAQQPTQNSGWGSPQQNGWGAPQTAPATPPPAIEENLEDDDIPF